MKKATIAALIAVTIAGAAALTCALEGCELHHPVDVDPNYPPPTPFGHCSIGVEWDAASGFQDEAGVWRYREFRSVSRCP